MATRMENPPPSAMSELWDTGRIILIGHVAVYCAAVLSIVLVRQAVYAAILAIAAVGVLPVLLEVIMPGAAFWSVMVVIAVAAIGAAGAAWYAVRKDIGWSP